MSKVEVFPVTNLPIIKTGDDLGELICRAAKKQDTPIQGGDIIVVTHIVVSRAEGNIINLDDIVPSPTAKAIAKDMDKDPALIEVILRETKSIIRIGDGHLITETKHGLICANAGVDRSNIPGERNVAPLPKDPDLSARRIRQRIMDFAGKEVRCFNFRHSWTCIAKWPNQRCGGNRWNETDAGPKRRKRPFWLHPPS